MDIKSMEKPAFPVESQQYSPNPRTKGQNKRLIAKSNNKVQNKTKNNSSTSNGTNAIHHQLINEVEPVPRETQKPTKESKGADTTNNFQETNVMAATKGANTLARQVYKISKELVKVKNVQPNIIEGKGSLTLFLIQVNPL